MQGHCTPDSLARFFLYLLKELKFLVHAIKGYRAAPSNVFALADTDLDADRVISKKFSSFERSSLPKQIKPPEWNLGF